MDIIATPRLSAKQRRLLDRLRADCGGYEPFIDEDGFYPLQYAAFEGAQMAGFLSVLEMPGESELTALVAPQFRRQGIFTQMLSAACRALSNEAAASLVCAVPPCFFQDGRTPSFSSAEPAFCELMMRARREDAPVCIPDGGSLKYHYGFSESGDAYFMHDESKDAADSCVPPQGVCRLSFERSFTAVYGVEVSEGLRGRGIGTQFFRHFMADYFAAHSAPLVLNVRDTNIPALALYKKCGFAEASRISYYHIRTP